MLTNGTVDDLRGEANQHQRRIRELEQHIQSDNRAEKLEESLKNIQERADEFEFQLSKLKQVRSLIWFPAEYADISYRPMPL
jgi:chromosome segregation ATPase